MRYLRRNQNVLTLITVLAQNVYAAIGKSLADRNVYPRGDSHLSTWSAPIEYRLQTKKKTHKEGHGKLSILRVHEHVEFVEASKGALDVVPNRQNQA